MGCGASNEEDKEEETKTSQEEEECKELPGVNFIKGENISKYFTIEKELGRGGSCRVLRVSKVGTNEQYAMKELSREDPWAPILFKQEIHILTTLTHPSVLQLSFLSLQLARCTLYMGVLRLRDCT